MDHKQLYTRFVTTGGYGPSEVKAEYRQATDEQVLQAAGRLLGLSKKPTTPALRRTPDDVLAGIANGYPNIGDAYRVLAEAYRTLDKSHRDLEKEHVELKEKLSQH